MGERGAPPRGGRGLVVRNGGMSAERGAREGLTVPLVSHTLPDTMGRQRHRGAGGCSDIPSLLSRELHRLLHSHGHHPKTSEMFNYGVVGLIQKHVF